MPNGPSPEMRGLSGPAVGGPEGRAPERGRPARQRPRPPNNPGLRALLNQKRRFAYTPDATARACGFQGWHGRGYLPHFDAPDVTQFVTFRLADAMPASRRSEWQTLLDLEDNRERRIQLEAYLDRGAGECWLRQARIASLVEQALGCFHDEWAGLLALGAQPSRTPSFQDHSPGAVPPLADHPAARLARLAPASAAGTAAPRVEGGVRLSRQPPCYRLRAWVIMPNHVHVLLDIGWVPLWQILESWKSFTAMEANKLLDRTGRFWEPEYWDERMRDSAQATRAVRYIENNPVKAGLVRTPQDWLWSSARFRTEYGKLRLEPTRTAGGGSERGYPARREA
jgi:REP element-mobilizing transposase RayT